MSSVFYALLCTINAVNKNNDFNIKIILSTWAYLLFLYLSTDVAAFKH